MNSSKSKSKVCAIIPFFNEEQFIRDIISDTLKYVDLVIAVNDGSIDNSEKLIQNISNVIILSFPKNHGKGFALQNGFDECLKRNFEFIITLDGDNQHDPDFIPAFIKDLDKYDIVIGNRLGEIKNMPFMRILSNKITSILLSLKTKQKIIDSQCGFRAYRSEVLKKVKTTSSGYEAESEILILASRMGFNIGFIEIPTVYADEKSKIKPVAVIFGFLRTLFR